MSCYTLAMEQIDKLTLKNEKVNTKNLKKIIPVYKKHKGLLIVVTFFMMCSGVLGILMPIFSANTLSSLAEGKFNMALRYTIIMCCLGLGKIIFNLLDEIFFVKVNLKLRFELTKMVIDSVNKTKMSTLDSTSLGALADRLSTDVNKISDTYLTLMDLTFNIITNVVFLCYIAYLNFYIFLILLVYVFVLYVVCSIKSRIWIKGSKITRRVKDIARSSYFEQIVGIRDVKLLNIKNEVTDYSHSKLKYALEIEESVRAKRNIIRRIQTAVSIVFELVFLIIGIAFVKKEFLLLAGLLVIYAYYGRVEGLISYMSSFKEFKAEAEISATRIFEVIEDYEKEEFGTETLEDFSGNIKLQDVSFGYHPETPVLKNLNMEFKPGEVTAIVGKSGSGKTTILSLISKLYDINSGEILLDEKNINTLCEEAIHSNIGEISQAPYIFNASIKQNLLFVKPEATDEEIVKVLKDAQIYKDVEKMPNGMDTEIGENGIKLSGGQKQRVAIARLMLMGSKVIVFDEATSALDNTSQNKIVKMLEKHKKDKTIIIVAHRLSTIVNADKIYMLDGGSVLAEGNHKWLMKNCKEYKELYELEEESTKIEE